MNKKIFTTLIIFALIKKITSEKKHIQMLHHSYTYHFFCLTIC